MKRLGKILFPPFYGLVIYTTIRLVNDTMGKGFRFWDRPIQVTLIEILSTIVVGYLFVIAFNLLEKKHFRSSKDSFQFKHIWKEVLAVIFVSLLIVNSAVIPTVALTDDGLSLSDFVQINILPTLYFLLYYAIRRGNYYIKEYINGKVRLEKMENDRLNSELEYLKGQFSPHFLFNGLNNIYFQMDKSVPDAKESVEKLSELLRYHLYQDQEKKVPLEKESEFIQLYIEVHKIRKSDKLSVAFKPSESKFEVYPHLFLPLVENAFKYVEGEQPKIEIKMDESENEIRFIITNTCRELKDSEGGIGLDNLKRRLALLYPDSHDFKTELRNNQFTAELTIQS